MFLTIFYAAATWIKCRKLNSLRKKIVELASKHSTIVLYKFNAESTSCNEVNAFPTSSTFCKNKDGAIIADLLFFEPNLRSCELVPQQIINVNNWIIFPEKEPFPVKISDEDTALEDKRLFLLIEANCLENVSSSEVNTYYLNQIGIPRAWRLGDTLGVIIESDIEHLTKMFSMFMSTPIFVDSCFEVCRMQTVAVEGSPCEMVHETQLNISRSPSIDSMAEVSPTRKWSNLSLQLSPLKWKHHMDLLRSYSNCADETVHGHPVQVPNHQFTSVAPGKKILELESPYLIDVSKAQCGSIVEDDSPECSMSTEIRIKNVDHPFDTSSRSSGESSIQSTPSKLDLQKKSTFSSLHSLASASTVSLRSPNQCSAIQKMKPPNVFIYAESPTTTENIKTLLNETLHKYKYTIYSVTESQLINSLWTSNCKLLVIGGNVPRRIEPLLISYFIRGGKMFCLCSSFLHTLLPFFRTAEIREQELVYFTYKKWKRIPLLHSVFCYQNSPSKNNFSSTSDEQGENT